MPKALKHSAAYFVFACAAFPSAVHAPAAPAQKSARSASAKSPRVASSKTAAAASPAISFAGADAQTAAFAGSGIASASLLEIITGSVAFGAVVVAGMLLSRQSVPAPMLISAEQISTSPTSEADGYDIEGGENSFL